MLLRIVNPGECPIEGFTVLGVSTSRDSEELIGEFGSGNKHAVNVCLRNGIPVTIFSGLTRVEFYTKPEQMGGKTFNRVYCKQSNRKPERLSMSAEYGEKDWTTIGMALREFVSNAIDMNKGQVKRRDENGKLQQVVVDVVSKPSKQKGKTTVCVPLTPEVQKWYSQLHLHFLQFDEKAEVKMKSHVLAKVKPSQCKVYRKGVLVHASKAEDHSLFDYNFGSDLAIDEARNLSESHIRDKVAEQVAKSEEVLKAVFANVDSLNKFYEGHVPEWELQFYGENEVWQKAWKGIHGNSVISLGHSPISEMAENKGYRVVYIDRPNWYGALGHHGIKTVLDVLDNVNDNGDVIQEPTAEDQAVLDRVWTLLELIDLTNGKEKPALKIYEQVMEGSKQKAGYQKDGTVFIHLEHRRNFQTYLEEVSHHVTGAFDCTRDFQDFAFRVAAKTAESAGL